LIKYLNNKIQPIKSVLVSEFLDNFNDSSNKDPEAIAVQQARNSFKKTIF